MRLLSTGRIRRTMMTRPLVLGLLALCASMLAGCAHYRLGTGASLSFRTLYVAPVENDVALPQAAALVTARVREAFLRDGRLTLAPGPESADVVLTLRLAEFDREVATVRPDDTGLARKVDLDLAATATLRDRRTGAVLFENRPLAARRQVFTDSGQIQAEYQTLPLLADKLAAEAVRAVVDIW